MKRPKGMRVTGVVWNRMFANAIEPDASPRGVLDASHAAAKVARRLIARLQAGAPVQKGELSRSETLLAQAAAAVPTDPTIRYHLAMVYAKQGKTAEARRALEQALRVPAFPEATSARQALESLR